MNKSLITGKQLLTTKQQSDKAKERLIGNTQNRANTQNSQIGQNTSLAWLLQKANINHESPHGAWMMDVIAAGTPSLAEQSNTVNRMLTIVGKKTFEEATPDDVVLYLHRSRQTCKPQSLDQYVGQIRALAEKNLFPWAEQAIWPLLRRGLKRLSTPRQHANPMTKEVFHQILRQTDLELGLASTCAFLSGSRLDEIFRLFHTSLVLIPRSNLATRFRELPKNFHFVALMSGKESKTGNDDDLRFVDIVLLDGNQLQSLKSLMARSAKPNSQEHLFTRRHTLTTILNKFNMTDHSFKGGCANILTELIRDEELPEEILPLLLKHKSSVDPIQSCTAGYLSVNGRLNMLQQKKVMDAAVQLRRRIFEDL